MVLGRGHVGSRRDAFIIRQPSAVFASTPALDELRCDADGDLLRSISPDLQPNRRVYLGQPSFVGTALDQFLPHPRDLALATDHANVTRLRPDGVLDHRFVMLMATRYRHDVRLIIDLEALEDCVEVLHTGLVRHRKAFLVGKGWPVIDDHDLEAEHLGNLGDLQRYMSTAEQIQRRDGNDGLDEDIECVARFEAPALRLLIADLKLQDRQVVLSHDLFALLPHAVLDESPLTDAPQHGAIGTQDQLRFLLHGCGNAARNHRGDGPLLSFSADTGDLLENRGHTIGDHGLDEDFDLPAAVEATLAGMLFGEDKGGNFGDIPLHHTLGFGPDVSFQTAAAHGADHGAILADEHLGLATHGQGTLAGDDRTQGTSLPFLFQPQNFSKYIVHRDDLRSVNLASSRV